LQAALDQVRFYNRVLTADEIAAHAAKKYEACEPAQGCTAGYDFERVGNDPFPGAGGAPPARIVGNVQEIDGAIGRAVRFMAGGHLEIAASEALNFTTALSYEAWINWPGECPPAKCVLERLFSRGSVRMDLHVGPNIRFEMTPWVYHADRIVTKGRWTHVAVTFDVGRGVLFYKDGVLFKTCPLN
jgi:hypothetical protein